MKFFLMYILPLLLGAIIGISNLDILHLFAEAVSQIFIRVFSFLSLPIMSLALISTIASYPKGLKGVSGGLLGYASVTTFIASCISCLLYLLILPTPLSLNDISLSENLNLSFGGKYLEYLIEVIPSDVVSPFLEKKVISVLSIAGAFGFAIRYIDDTEKRQVITCFFKGLYEVFIIFSKITVRFLPIGLCAFAALAVKEFTESSQDFRSIAGYLCVVVSANLLQGFIILPILLYFRGISPIAVARGSYPALVTAFFSKSSSGTLPLTMECVVKNLGISEKIARIVLPLCTVLNMNGCAAFIFTTVAYVIEGNGGILEPLTLFGLILLSTIAALGNAGVPMGCFFMSAGIISAMGLRPEILGLILPFYALIDMLETALNVWSDICITYVVDKRIK